LNTQISRLAFVATSLLAALIVATTYWQTWAVAGLEERQDNAIQRVAEFTIQRGLIYASDGRTVLAKNRVRRFQGKSLFFRRYPPGGLVAQTVGYSTQVRSRAGLERSENDFLTGANKNLGTVLKTTLDRLKGVTVKGNNLVLTIDARVQKIAMDALAGKCGAVVALEPSSGKVRVLASQPTFAPNDVERHFGRIVHRRGPCRPAAPLLNRATNGLFTPGSTFKAVTAAAALDTGKFTPSSVFSDPGYCIEYGKRVFNAGNPDQNGPEQFGSLSFATGFQHSVNSVFCNIGKALGAGTILDYAKRFGFYSVPPLETPANERSPSGLYEGPNLFRPKRPQFQVDPGRLAFGQERLLVTPLQMAMVAGAIANRGVVMKLHVVDRIVAQDGKLVTRTKPDELGRAIKSETAAALTSMMVSVVTGGTGTHAQIPGISVAGKTGTAETGRGNIYTAWFIAFAPAEAPRVAVAVVVQDQLNGFGGTIAAPIARTIMQALLRSGSNSR
jgi:penicillin-binding protein A